MISITCYRHFWHAGYDKACLLTDVSRNGTVDAGGGGHLENPG